MHRQRWRFLLLSVSIALAPAAEKKPAEFFEKQVRPILAERCYGCHSAGSQPLMSGLRLDEREAVLKGGTRGPAVKPGDPAQSLLLQAVRQEGALKMPPTGKLRDAEISILTEWVRDGAVWGANPRLSTRTPATAFWAFQPVSKLEPPPVSAASWVQSPIDRFVLAALESKGLRPAPPADKRTLIRRATFDLTGLPPTPAEIRDFLADTSPGAFARVIDRLLESPRYGERWGRHWLDVARYADSNGLDENLVFVNAWRYRDYVIKAFNQDKPFDRFVQEQIAGDLLPRTGSAEAGYDQLIATGFLALGAKMLAEDDPVKMEMDIVDEQVDTAARAFMGLTLGCARCHDHKFDPIPSADYYSIAGIFRSTKTMENFKVVAKWNENVLAPDEERQKLRDHEAKIEAKRKELEAVTKPANEELQQAARQRINDYLLGGSELLRSEAIVLPHATDPAARTFDHVFEHEKEFAFEAPAAGAYQLEIHYASAESRPVELRINGEVLKSKALSNATGTSSPDTWSVEGIFELKAGRNTVRLDRPGRFFPKTDKLLVVPATLSEENRPKTAQQLASRFGANPAFLSQWSEFLRRTQDDPNSVLHEWHQASADQRPALASRLESEFLAAAAAANPDPRQRLLREVLEDKFGPFAVPPNPSRFYPSAARAQTEVIQAAIKDLEKAAPQFPRAMGVAEGKPANLRIHLRGNHLTLGDEVPRQFLRVIAGDRQEPIPTDRSGRLEFARWLTSDRHPLTGRVFVNRVWRWHFGAGIVPSVDNFGRLGEAPSNQALLDWLTQRFVESGWRIKPLHRLVMLSSTYQMSTAYDEKQFTADPENKLLWRMNRRRLEAEEIRDAIFAVSGQLDRAMGGTMLKFKDREYVTSTENRDTTDYDAMRRSVYLPVIRSSLYDVFQAFDFGDPSVTNGDRPTTTVAPQALFLMNGSAVQKASKAMAAALIEESLSQDTRIASAFERAYGRPPSATEQARSREFVSKLDSRYVSFEPDAGRRAPMVWQSFCKALLAANEFIYVE